MDKNKTTPEKTSKKMSLDVSNILVDEKKATMTITVSWIDNTPPDNIELTGTLFTMMYQMQNVFMSEPDKDLNTVEKKFYDTLKGTIKYILEERKERQGIIDATTGLGIVSKNGAKKTTLPLKRVRSQEAIDKARLTRSLNKLKKLNTKEPHNKETQKQ